MNEYIFAIMSNELLMVCDKKIIGNLFLILLIQVCLNIDMVLFLFENRHQFCQFIAFLSDFIVLIREILVAFFLS